MCARSMALHCAEAQGGSRESKVPKACLNARGATGAGRWSHGCRTSLLSAKAPCLRLNEVNVRIEGGTIN